MVKVVVVKYVWNDEWFDWAEEWMKEYKIIDADYNEVKRVLDSKLKGDDDWYWREYGDYRFEIEIYMNGSGKEMNIEEFREMVKAIAWLDAFENWKW